VRGRQLAPLVDQRRHVRAGDQRAGKLVRLWLVQAREVAKGNVELAPPQRLECLRKVAPHADVDDRLRVPVGEGPHERAHGL
jgi:hypothetical protein